MSQQYKVGSHVNAIFTGYPISGTVVEIFNDTEYHLTNIRSNICLELMGVTDLLILHSEIL